MNASTRHPDGLCPPAVLLRRCVSLAVLDAVLSPEWDSRYYSFDPKWAPNELMGSMRDGQGDHLFIAFGANGTFLKGFAHESSMSPWRGGKGGQMWPDLFRGLPIALHKQRDEPAFMREETTYCMWWTPSDQSWKLGVRKFPEGADPDGSMEQLGAYDGSPDTYVRYATDYFELEPPRAVVEAVFAHERLTADMIRALNDEVDVKAAMREIRSIGYGKY